MAATEQEGSGRLWDKQGMRYAEYIAVAATAAEKPAIGALYTEFGGSVDSGVTGRRCIQSEATPAYIKGIFRIHAIYAGPVART